MASMFKVKGLIITMLMTVILVGCSQGEGVVNTLKEDSRVNAMETDTGKTVADASQPVMNLVNGEMKVHFFDVGQAEATLIESVSNNEKHTILIDTGDLGANDTIDYLNKKGVKDIDVVVGTHPHADHIGQMDKVIENFNVGEVWMSGDTSTSQIYQKVMRAVKDNEVGYEEPRAGDVYDIGGMEITILSPKSVDGDLNDGSIEMRVEFGNVDFMFTGDGETGAEQGILARGHKVNAKIMKLGHHGSKTSTTSEFFKSVSPEVAIYSAGKGNSYGHPSKEVVDRVQGAGVKLYGTDTHGTVVVTTDGKTYSVNAEKEGTIKPPATGENAVAQETHVETKKEVVQEHSSPAVNCVDLNTSTPEQLKQIKHINDERSLMVVEGRPYTSVDQLTKVKGIATKRLDDIKLEGLACVK